MKEKCAMRLFVIGSVCLALVSCAARSPYVKAPVPTENLNAAIAGVSLDVTGDGDCTLLLAIKGSGTGRVDAPRAWCADAKQVKSALATVPPPAPAPKAAEAAK